MERDGEGERGREVEGREQFHLNNNYSSLVKLVLRLRLKKPPLSMICWQPSVKRPFELKINILTRVGRKESGQFH